MPRDDTGGHSAASPATREGTGITYIVRSLAAVGVSLVTLYPLSVPERVGAQEECPNILLILTDDQRAIGTMSVMPETLRIFRDGGTKYTHAVATTPLCCPSRASIFSGRYAHNHGVLRNELSENFDATRSMQYELGLAGYKTALVGRYLNNWHLRDPPHFDKWAMLSPGTYYGSTFNVNGETRTVSAYSTDFIGKKAVDFLDRFETQDAAPWFMEVAPFAPHYPADFESRYADVPLRRWRQTPAVGETDLSDKPAFLRQSTYTEEEARVLRRRQLRSLMSVDEEVAAIFRRLEALGEAHNTLAFFLSDNGWMWFEHHLSGKRVPYTASVRVPLFARWPTHIRAGVRNHAIVANIDIAPTVYAAAGVEPSYPVDGESLLTPTDRRYIYIEYFRGRHPLPIPKWHAIWTPSTTYVRYFGTDPLREYYDRRDDRWQLDNVYRDGLPGNEPTDASQFDGSLTSGARCVGGSCP